MASGNMSMWLLTIRSRHPLTNAHRDLIVEIVNDEAQHSKETLLILHDVLEGKRRSILAIETTRNGIAHLARSLADTLPFRFASQIQQL